MTSLTPSAEQRAIMDNGLATMRIRAGAGTGKTTTIALVIANLIDTELVTPERVLGLTFTNKAASELADRIRLELGMVAEPGRQAEIHTYHGFAAQILAEFGPLAGVDNRATVITPTFARQIMMDTFHHRSYQHVDITQSRSLDRIRRLGDRLGDHLLQPQDLLDAPRESDDPVWLSRVEMAETLSSYEHDKRRLKVVDYSDLVTLSHQILAGFSELAKTIRERYDVVVLDEYQDTNPAQRTLLMELFGDGFPVIAVGDEDQTIYEWRGASAENFTRFGAFFNGPHGSPAIEKGLTLNRRSSQIVLNVANEVRHRANAEADTLFAADQGLSGEVVTHWAADSTAEANWIANQFELLNDQGLPWSEMAVLFRKNKDFSPVIDALTRHDIPFEVANVGGLLSVAEVSELKAWLTILDRPDDSAALLQILFGSRYRLGMADVAPLAYWAQAANKLTDSPRQDDDDVAAVTLIEAMEKAEQIDGLEPGAKHKVARFIEIYRHLLEASQGMSLIETCRLILDRTLSWQEVEALPSTPRLTARLNLYRFLDLADDWSPIEGRPSTSSFLDYLESMEEEPAEELDAARLSGEDAVTLVTVHRAKGLEWDTVSIPALYRGNFPSAPQQYPDPVRFGEFVPADMRIDDVLAAMPAEDDERKAFMRRRHFDQEWRVAYVAITRAKTRLLASGAYWYGVTEPTKNEKAPSDLFKLIDDHPNTSTRWKAPKGPRPSVLRVIDEGHDPDPVFAAGWPHALRAGKADSKLFDEASTAIGELDEYKRLVQESHERLFQLAEPTDVAPTQPRKALSVTSLVTMAQCPKRYFWTEVDPLPRRPSRAAQRGTRVHRLIELHQRGQVAFDDVIEDFYDVPDAGQGHNSYETYLDSPYSSRRASLIEAPFSLQIDNGFQIRGRIDAIYAEDGNWEIVDFKSGRRSKDPSRALQLQAYAVAANEIDFGLPKPSRLEVSFAYLGDGLDIESAVVDGPWLEQAREAIATTTESIRKEAFGEDPGPWCGTCDFLQFCAPGQSATSK